MFYYLCLKYGVSLICNAELSKLIWGFNRLHFYIPSDPPTSIVINPNPIVVREGNTITATCTAQGNPTPGYQWYKKDDLNTILQTGSQLRILNAQDANKGEYVCRAINAFGTNDAQTTVDVQCK